MRISAPLLLFSILAGCAATGPTPEQQATYRNTIPECHTERECEAMWAAARRWVLDNSSRKIQNITDGYIETYNPEPYSPRIAVRVTKEPLLSDDGYRFRVEIWCANLFGCQPDQHEAAIDFNTAVGVYSEE